VPGCPSKLLNSVLMTRRDIRWSANNDFFINTHFRVQITSLWFTYLSGIASLAHINLPLRVSPVDTYEI